jgi:septal ring-binding cell division protein DamX
MSDQLPADGQPSPFAQPARASFPSSGYRTALALLLEATSAPGAVSVVTGLLGAGKTTLCRALATSLGPGVAVIRSHGALLNGLSDLDRILGRAPAPAADSPVIPHCAILVDDAQLLKRAVLDRLLARAEERRFALVLFATPPFAQRIQRRRKGPVDLRHLVLGGLTGDEVAQYLEWRWTSAGRSDALPLDANRIEYLARESAGLPGQLDRLADRLVTAGSAPPVRRVRTPFLLALAATLAGTALLADRVWNAARTDAGTIVHADPAVPAATVQPTPPSRPPGPAPTPVLEAVPAARSAADSADSADSAEGHSEASTAAPQDPSLDHPPGSGQAIPIEQPPTSDAGPSTLAHGAEDGTPSSSAPPETNDPQPSVKQHVRPAGALSPPDEPQQREPVAYDREGRADEQQLAWLFDQPPTNYTLQIAVVSSAEGAMAYVSAQSDPSRFVYYPISLGGGRRYVILHGSYATSADAERDAETLSRPPGTAAPWVRRMRVVQEIARE